VCANVYLISQAWIRLTLR